MSDKKILLSEVTYLRPIAIFLLVIAHAIGKMGSTPFGIQNFELMPIYKWLVEIISGFQIHTLVLVAGYIFAFQSQELKRKYVFSSFAAKKAHRIILPMIIFGILYYFCFYYNLDTFTILGFVLKVLSGCGHLWFLSMLFWCFMLIWIVDHYKLISWKWFLFFVIASAIPLPSFYFGLENAPRYFIFMYSGYCLWMHRNSILRTFFTRKNILILCLLYLLFTAAVHFCNLYYNNDYTVLSKVLVLTCTNILKLLTAFCGISALYLLIMKTTRKEHHSPHPFILIANKYCYGIYIYHQFIILYLYYFTPIYNNVNRLIMPWIVLVITLVLSITFTHFTLKNKMGKYLIG